MKRIIATFTQRHYEPGNRFYRHSRGLNERDAAILSVPIDT
jgi:hypothetical protein